MSSSTFDERVSVLRRSIAAGARGDIDGAVQAMTEDVEVRFPPEYPGGGTIRGHESWRRAQLEFEEAFADVVYEPEEFLEAGDRVLVSIRYRGHARHTEIPVDMPVYWLYAFRGDKVARMDVYLDRPSALSAAGLSDPAA